MTILSEYRFLVFSILPGAVPAMSSAAEKRIASFGMQTRRWRNRFQIRDLDVGEPQAGGRHLMRVAFYEPRTTPGITVQVANYRDGWSSLVWCLSKDLPGRFISFTIGSADDEWPAYKFNVHERDRHRHVSLLRDVDRWKFWQEGDPLPEEDVDSYKKRRSIDRLNRESLTRLAERLGFPIQDDRFWDSTGYADFFEEVRPEPRRSEP